MEAASVEVEAPLVDPGGQEDLHKVVASTNAMEIYKERDHATLSPMVHVGFVVEVTWRQILPVLEILQILAPLSDFACKPNLSLTS